MNGIGTISENSHIFAAIEKGIADSTVADTLSSSSLIPGMEGRFGGNR